MSLVHGSCVAVGGRGVLISGGSGSGKSDLALRLIDGGGELVADDYVELEPVAGNLLARAPEPLAGLMEVRGLGLLRMPCRAQAPLVLQVELLERSEPLERLPEPVHREIAGVRLRLVRLSAFESSAAAKVRLSLRTLVEDGDEAHALA